MDVLTFTSPDGSLRAQASCAGGILTSLAWRDSRGADTEVLYQAPWLNEPAQDAALPPLMRRLAGEWVGVPFGCVEHDDPLFLQDAPHGLPVNGTWRLTEQTAHALQMRFDYPAHYPLAQLERRITLSGGGAADFSLTIYARETCRVPVGLHPIFPFGGDAGDVTIQTHGGGMVYPRATEPGISRLTPGARFTHLRAVPAGGDATCDISRLPLAYDSEEIVQLLEPQGNVTLSYAQRRLRVALSWDDRLLPHCLLWISNAGRRFSPWNGRNYCLGVEPICSAWDLGPLSLADNPITLNGTPTAVDLRAGEALTLTYQICCSEIN